MITAAKFYGNALYWSGATLYRVPARVLNIGTVPGSPGLELPSRTGLIPGGPYFKLINPSGGHAVPLKQPGGAALITIATNTLTTVVLGTSKWYAKSRTLNASRTFSSTGSDRTAAVGYVPAVTPVTPPLSYDPILCDGGYRRARFCENGGKSNLWMLDSEVTPNFVSGIAACSYAGQCFFFAEDDRLLISHGSVIAGADVTWYATCADCMAGNLCDFSNPHWPQSVRVRINDPGLPYLPGVDDFNLNGDWVLYSDGASQYSITSGSAGAGLLITLACTGTTWAITLQYLSGGGDASNSFEVAVTPAGPPIGTYPMTSSEGSGAFPTGLWDNAIVTLLGWGA